MCLIEEETIDLVISIPYLISIFSTRHQLFSPINHPSRGQCLGLHRPVIILKTSSNLTPREALKTCSVLVVGRYKLGIEGFLLILSLLGSWHLLVVRIVVYCYGLDSIDTRQFVLYYFPLRAKWKVKGASSSTHPIYSWSINNVTLCYYLKIFLNIYFCQIPISSPTKSQTRSSEIPFKWHRFSCNMCKLWHFL